MQTTSRRIWTRVTVSISNDDNTTPQMPPDDVSTYLSLRVCTIDAEKWWNFYAALSKRIIKELKIIYDIHEYITFFKFKITLTYISNTRLEHFIFTIESLLSFINQIWHKIHFCFCYVIGTVNYKEMSN